MKLLLTMAIISLLLLPSFVSAEEVQAQLVEQISFPGSDANYTSDIRDFEKTLSEYMPPGIYAGPHFTPPKYAIKYSGDIRITTSFTISQDNFAYGVSDYYIYIPVLLSPDTVDMLIEIDDFLFLQDEYFVDAVAFAQNYETLSQHHLIYYVPELGYIAHIPFYPLQPGTHTITIAFRTHTDSAIELLLSQENTIFNTTLDVGVFTSWNWEYMSVEHSAQGFPLALAFMATQGLTRFGLGAVEMPPSLGIYTQIVTPNGGKYATVDMPWHFRKPDYVHIHYVWKAESGVYEKDRNAYVKNFIIHSTDTKLEQPASGSLTYANFTLYPDSDSNYIIFVSAQGEEHTWTTLIYDRLSQHTWDYSDYASHIVCSVKLTDERYVALNASSWRISRSEFAQLALTNGMLIQYYELSNLQGPAGSLAAYFANEQEAKLLIASGAKKIDSQQVGFSLYTKGLMDMLKEFGKIVYQQLLRFWNYIIREVKLFWSWIAPVLQLGTYLAFMIFTMVVLKYSSKFFRRDENATP